MEAPPVSTVLVVDDAADTRQMLNEILKPHFVVLLAKNGEQALDRARNKQPDVILLDVLMPGMSGYEVLANLQMDECTRDIPVVFLTGMDSDTDVERGLQHGSVDYIKKPFVGEIVVARTTKYAQLGRETRQARVAAKGFDSGTGLPNRESLLAHMETECRRAARNGSSCALLLVDAKPDQPFVPSALVSALLAKVAKSVGEVLHDTAPWSAREGVQRLGFVLPEAQLLDIQSPVGTVVTTMLCEQGPSLADGLLHYRSCVTVWTHQSGESVDAILARAGGELDAMQWQEARGQPR
jgi:CheY-like chemotaxis protein